MYCVVYSDHICMLTTCNCWLWHWVIICGGQIRVGVCSVYFLSCFIFCFKFRKLSNILVLGYSLLVTTYYKLRSILTH